MLVIFLGAGFSAAVGLPLAKDLFAEVPTVDVITRQRLVQRVIERWSHWGSRTGGAPEEYLSHLEVEGGREWQDAVRYVALTIALKMGRVEYVGANPRVTRHNLDRTSPDLHEIFWEAIFGATPNVCVITTNYDVLPERGIRHMPRPRKHRPGFHYGFGPEELAGGGYPSYSHIQKIKTSGTVPLLKLHGSVSWSVRNGHVVHYHDCRPGVRGDALIVAPIKGKQKANLLIPIWEQAAISLKVADQWLFIGYSLPLYDEQILNLLRENSGHRPRILVSDTNPSICEWYKSQLDLPVENLGGLIEMLPLIAEVLHK
jgi:hypothetical protein